jgi:hypothetical protein
MGVLPQSEAYDLVAAPHETNHEQTLSVPYVFRNLLISAKQVE